MPLLEYQNAMGRLIRVPDRADPLASLPLDATERSSLQTLAQDPGFVFTMGVQRSWCVARTTNAATFTLSILPEQLRRSLIDSWINAGGGVSSFYAAEADAFLEFAAKRLPDPSHELTMCRVEQATLRAHDGSLRFTAPELAHLHAPNCVLRRGRQATLVTFHGPPQTILRALEQHQAAPPISPERTFMLFAPGLPSLCRVASSDEIAVWEHLARPLSHEVLRAEGHAGNFVEEMLQIGAVEFDC